MLDTAALIAWPISELTGGLVVIHQEQELIRISPDRAALLDSMGLVFWLFEKHLNVGGCQI